MANTKIIAIIGHEKMLPADLLDPFEKAACYVYSHGLVSKAVAMAGQEETTFIGDLSRAEAAIICGHFLLHRDEYPNIKVHLVLPTLDDLAEAPPFYFELWHMADQKTILTHEQMISQATGLLAFLLEPDQEPAVQYAKELGLPVHHFRPRDVYRDEATYFDTFDDKRRDHIFKYYRKRADFYDFIEYIDSVHPIRPDILDELADFLAQDE